MDWIVILILLYLILMGMSFASGLGWHASRELWPHLRPWFHRSTVWKGKYRGQTYWVFVIGKRVIFRVPFTTKRQT